MNRRQLNKIIKKLTLEDLESLLAKKPKSPEKELWQKLVHLGGSKSDTYAKATNNYSYIRDGQYYRVRENPRPDTSYTWLQNAVDVQEQKDCYESYGSKHGGGGTPMNESEFEIVWKDGKPV